MRVPVKLNKESWLNRWVNFFPSANDPRVLCTDNDDFKIFSKAVSVFKFGTTFKTTEYYRYPLTIEKLKKINFDSPPVVLDAGASDGSASIHLIESIDFKKMYITDMHTYMYWREKNGVTCFYDSNYNCILMVNNFFIVYADYQDAFFPLNLIARYFLSSSFEIDEKFKKIKLINPALKKVKKKVNIFQYDIFDEWEREKLDVIVAANVLNKTYFSNKQILKAVKMMVSNLNRNGRIVVVDSRTIEKSSIFSLNNNVISIEAEINGGTEIKDLILSLN